MIDWASADIDKLLLLAAEKQLWAVSEREKVEAKKSETLATSTLKMNVCTGLQYATQAETPNAETGFRLWACWLHPSRFPSF